MQVVYITNAFSLQMLASAGSARIDAHRLLGVEEARVAILEEQSTGAVVVPAIGHADTAAVVADQLGLPALGSLFERRSILLDEASILLVAQYKGSRLPEGATTLPEGAEIEWWQITIEKQ